MNQERSGFQISHVHFWGQYLLHHTMIVLPSGLDFELNLNHMH